MFAKTYIHSASLSKFGKTDLSNLELSKNTANQCLEYFDRDKIDLLIYTSFAPEVYTKEFHLAAKLADSLRIKNAFCIRAETASSSGASALHLAVELLQSNRFKNALVVSTEILSRLGREESNLVLGSVLSTRMQNFSMSMAQGAAMITNLYLEKYKYTKKDLYPLSKKLHDNGLLNQFAHIHKNLTEEEYFKAPLFCAPLGLYDISPLSDGSSAIILSSEVKSSFVIKGIGNGTSSFYNMNLNTSFGASIQAFHKAYLEAEIKPSDIQVAELHDAFTTFELIGAEDAGLCKEGHALKNVLEGVSSINGDLPINPSGGLKSRGHPIAASGLAQIFELIRFMQKNNKSLGLAHSIGGLATNNFATILEQI
jgi:acetyl-CoA acetyltransferase